MRWFVFIFLMAALPARAQLVQNFELTNVVDGNMLSLKNYSSNPGVIIIVTTIHCPYTDYYLGRIKTLAETYKGRVPVLLINSSMEEDEPTMTAYTRQNKITFPYLTDKEQKVLLNLNPRKSPEAFLLQNTSGKFKIVYRGAIDDNAQSEKDVNHAYLQNAIEALLNGQKLEPTDIRPVGCSIKKN